MKWDGRLTEAMVETRLWRDLAEAGLIPTKIVEVSEGSQRVTVPDWQPEATYWRDECLRARSENITLKREMYSRKRALRVLLGR